MISHQTWSGLVCKRGIAGKYAPSAVPPCTNMNFEKVNDDSQKELRLVPRETSLLAAVHTHTHTDTACLQLMLQQAINEIWQRVGLQILQIILLIYWSLFSRYGAEEESKVMSLMYLFSLFNSPKPIYCDTWYTGTWQCDPEQWTGDSPTTLSPVSIPILLMAAANNATSRLSSPKVTFTISSSASAGGNRR